MTELEIVEVSPRDGLQNEAAELSTDQKIELIRRSVAAGIQRIEVASFVNPRRVPRMADAEAVCAGIAGTPVITIGLALNLRGVERALATGVSEIGLVAAATDGFGLANQGRTADDSVNDALAGMARAHEVGRPVQVTLSTAFGCPFDGEVATARIADLARRLAAGEPREIALADTIGVAAPGQVDRVLRAVRQAVPGIPLRCHFHDTRGTAVANAWSAVGAGVRVLDSALGGLGGCPFAPGATGNVATEDLLYALERSGIHTGVSLEQVVEASRWVGTAIGRQLPSRLSQAAAFLARR